MLPSKLTVSQRQRLSFPLVHITGLFKLLLGVFTVGSSREKIMRSIVLSLAFITGIIASGCVCSIGAKRVIIIPANHPNSGYEEVRYQDLHPPVIEM